MLSQDYKDFFSLEKRRTLFKALIESHFKYCPLVWMFHGRQANHKIKRLHERALRIAYNDYVPSFQDLLNEYNWFTMHCQHITTQIIYLEEPLKVFLL